MGVEQTMLGEEDQNLDASMDVSWGCPVDDEDGSRQLYLVMPGDSPTISPVQGALNTKRIKSALNPNNIVRPVAPIQRQWYQVEGESNLRKNLDGLPAGTSFKIVCFDENNEPHTSTAWVTSGRTWRGY